MHRKFIALVLSGSLALSGFTAQPAKADEIADWIAGAAALAIIGLAISEANKKPKPATNHAYTHVPQTYEGNGRYTDGRNHGYSDPYIYPPVTHVPTPRHPKILPPQCRTKARMNGHVIRGLGKRCLKRAGVDVQRLPAHCKIKVRNPHNGKRKTVFGGRCLRQHGYSLARAH